MASEKKKSNRSSVSVQIKRDKDRLHVWTKKRRQDPTYRKQCAERQKAKHDQLVADAEFGRLCRAFLANVGVMISECANLWHIAIAGEAQSRFESKQNKGK